jgi:DegV family protein with EDD domain
MPIKIVIDSSSDISKEEAVQLGIEVIPMIVAFDKDEYYDGVDLTPKEFYEKLIESDVLPKTSQITPFRYMEVYERLVKEGYDVIVITLSSKLSNTYSSAVLAKSIYLENNPESNKKIEVIDSLSGSIGVGLMVHKAYELAQQGKKLDEVVEYIESIKKDIVFYGTLDTLENAIKGGRVNPIAGKLINALNFKVIIEISEGIVKPIDKARGESNSMKKLFERVKENISDVENKIIVIGHSNCEDKAMKIAKNIEENYSFKKVIISSIGPVMGTYTSEGAILIATL